jgi:hypothetical protein
MITMVATISRHREPATNNAQNDAPEVSGTPETDPTVTAPEAPEFSVGAPNESQNGSGRANSTDGLTNGDLLNGLALDLDMPTITRQGAGRAPNPEDPTVIANLDAMLAAGKGFAVVATDNANFRKDVKSTVNKWLKRHDGQGVTVRYTNVTADMLTLQNGTGEFLRARTDTTKIGKLSVDAKDNTKPVTVIYRIEKVS